VPFVAYVPAVHLQWSGVLAVVVAGVYVNRRTPRVLTPATRLFGSGWWEATVFLVNVLIFVVLGMQLHDIAGRVLSRHAWTELLLDAAVLTAVVVGLRFAWVFAQGALPFMAPRDHGAADAKHLAVTAMAGFRGAVSLAAALGIPAVVAGGAAFPERDLIVFLTFAIILVTLVGGGLVLPYAIRALRLPPARDERDELRLAMQAVADAALAALDGAARENGLDAESTTLLRRRYEEMRDRYDDGDLALNDAEANALAAAQRRVGAAQRDALLGLRERGDVDNTVMRRVLTLLDLRELETERFAERIGDRER
jgi:CPA1 family monovalent cation:H+ antiporter